MATQSAPALSVSASLDSQSNKTARRHDQRAHIPNNAEASLVGLDEHYDVLGGDRALGDRDAFNAFFADAVAAYNEGKKPSRQIVDYYEKVAGEKARGSSGARVLIEEVVLQVGNHNDAGVTDAGFDAREWKRLKEADRAAGVAPGSDGSRAAAYVREHLVGGLDPDAMRFDVREWSRLRAEDRALGRDPNERGSRAWTYADDALAHAPTATRQRAALEMVRETWSEHYPNLHLVRFDIHADEPDGTIHAHAVYIPFVDRSDVVAAGKRVHGPRVQCSMKQALKAMGLRNGKGPDGKPEFAVERLRASMRAHMADCATVCGIVVEDKGVERKHLPTAVYREEAQKADERLESTRAEALAAERRRDTALEDARAASAELVRVSASLADAEDEHEAVRAEVERARAEASRARSERREAEADARRAMALADVVENGYAPPVFEGAEALREGVDYERTDEMEAIDLWFAFGGSVPDGRLEGLDVPEPTRRMMRDGDEEGLSARVDEAVAEQVRDGRRPGQVVWAGRYAWWVDDVEGLTLNRERAEQDIWEAIEPAVAAGLDPTEPYAGLKEREDEVSEREEAADEREGALGKREADVERREGAATERERAVAARERRAAGAEAANERRAADLTAAADELSRAKDQLSDVPQIEGRDADEFADDVVMTFAHELAASGIPAYVECADTMRRQWKFGHQQRVVEGAGFVSDRTLREIVLDTVRRGGEVVQRIKDGLKATIDRALEALGRQETAEQRARRTQRAAVQARGVARATPTARNDFAFRGLSDLERPTPGPSTGAQHPHEHGEMGL